MRYSVGVFLLMFSTLPGCRSKLTDPADPGYGYFPLATGRYVVYNVSETRYALNAAPARQTYQRKETIGAAYTDVTGQPAYRLLRYRRPADRQPWVSDSVWSVRLMNNEAIRTENGLDFVCLTFPPANGLTWNGNRYNAAGPDDYVLLNAGRPYTVGGQTFDRTLTVVQRNDSTGVGQDRRVLVYAPDVGLIYRERVQVQYCASPGCAGKGQIEYGIRQEYRVWAYGRE